MTTDELIQAVIAWGDKHKLNSPTRQLNKVIEEVGEIAHEITRNRYNSMELVDALGDTLVTIIILTDILGYDPMGCLGAAYAVISDRNGHTEEGTFIKEENESHKD